MNQQVNIAEKPKQKRSNKSYRIIRLIHIYTSMLMLLIMLFFVVTGLTLNHREWLPNAPAAEMLEIELPPKFATSENWNRSPIIEAEKVRNWLSESQSVYGKRISYEWSEDEQLMLIDIKRPGGYSLIEVQLEDSLILLEQQNYGVAAVLNDLHMGRNSGQVWRAFIDVSAVLMLLFTLTGFWLVLPQKKRRDRLLVVSGFGTLVMVAAYVVIRLG